MKKIYLFILICLLSTVMYADNLGITLCWSPSCSSAVVGYKVYSCIASNGITSVGQVLDKDCSSTNVWVHGIYQVSYNSVVDAGNSTSYVFSNLLVDTTYIFSATAYDTNGIESDFSGQAIYRTPMAYTNGGTPPKQNFAISSYTTNWFGQPLITTNKQGRISTNYYSLSVRTYKLSSDLYIRTNWANWVILVNTNLAKTNWMVYQYGSNSVPSVTITNLGGAAFFRIKL